MYIFIFLVVHGRFMGIYIGQIVPLKYVQFIVEWLHLNKVIFFLNCAHSKTKQIFTAALFTKDKTASDPNSSTGEWIKQNISHTMEIIRPWKRMKSWFMLLIHTTTWMNLKNIRQVKEARHKGLHIVGSSLYEIYRQGKAIYEISVCLGQG